MRTAIFILALVLHGLTLNAQIVDRHVRFASGETCTCDGTNVYGTTAAAGRCGNPDSTGAHSAGYTVITGTFDTGDSGNYDSTAQAYEGTTSLIINNTDGTPVTTDGIRTNNHTITGSGGNSVKITLRYYSVSGNVRVQIGQTTTSYSDVVNLTSPTRNTWTEVTLTKAAHATNDWGWRIYFYSDGEWYADCINLEII